MKTKMKALTLALCAVLLVATTVFVTVAYLTSTTETVTNTFTVGQVAITLDEADVDKNGIRLTNDNGELRERVTENEYKLIPGHTYVKDPTVHVDEDSELCYVFVKVSNALTVGDTTIEANTTDKPSIATQMANKNWKAVAGQTGLYIYAVGDAVKTIVSPGDDLVVFENFTIASTVTDLSAYVTEYQTDDNGEYVTDNNGNKILVENTDLIIVQAYAIQADGFENMTPAEIWGAFDGTK